MTSIDSSTEAYVSVDGLVVSLDGGVLSLTPRASASCAVGATA
jgi:hypothetical protein